MRQDELITPTAKHRSNSFHFNHWPTGHVNRHVKMARPPPETWTCSVMTLLFNKPSSTHSDAALSLVHFDSCSLMRLQGCDRCFMKILYDV